MTNYNLYGDHLPEEEYTKWQESLTLNTGSDSRMAFQAGWDAALANKAEESVDLSTYEGIGTKDQLLVAVRQASILTDYIDGLPQPLQRAWRAYLTEQKAI